jgi:hypothetical protein
MATNRKRRTIVEETLDDKEGVQNEDTDVVDYIVVMSKVYRLNGGSKSFVTQTQEPVDELFLQNNYPQGGKYIVYEFNTLNQQINSVNYEIEPKTIATNGSSNGVVNSSNDIQIRMLFEELNHSRQMVLTLISQLGNNKGGSVSELVNALASLHQISGGTQGKDPVDLLIKGMELGQNGGKVSSDWKSELLSTIKDVAPAALGAITANRQPVAALPPGVQSMIPNQQPTEEEMLKAYIKQIKTQIIGGVNPELAVEWITSNARDIDYQMLLRLAIHGTVDNFIMLDSEIANEPFRTWFTSAITMVKEWYAGQQEIQTDDDMDRGNGHSSDIKHDATVSTRRTNVSKTV